MNEQVYIMVPERNDSGGVESLYQIAHLLNNLGKKAFIFFDTNDKSPHLDKFSKYNIKWVNTIEDIDKNLLIVPEIWTDKLQSYSNIKKTIWWLSVTHNWGKFQDFDNKKIEHLCQSYYAQHYLYAMGCYHSTILNDYIDIDFSLTTPKKEDIVCYNPAKGKEITEEIIFRNKHIKFMPISGLTRIEAIELLSKSKVYIDFGHHPGRDRIPREAAILNNCIITGLLGSARYFSDMPIPNYYKIENITDVDSLINDCLLNYSDRIIEFEQYRRVILSQKQEMEMIIKRIFI